MAIENIGQDLFLRHTNTDGRSYSQQHRVWDKDLFIASQQKAVDKVNADAVAKGGKAKARVDHITAEQYQQERSK